VYEHRYERGGMREHILIVLPAELQVSEKAVMAASVLLPHRFLIWLMTFEASTPQMVLRSAGFGSVLLWCVSDPV